MRKPERVNTELKYFILGMLSNVEDVEAEEQAVSKGQQNVSSTEMEQNTSSSNQEDSSNNTNSCNGVAMIPPVANDTRKAKAKQASFAADSTSFSTSTANSSSSEESTTPPSEWQKFGPEEQTKNEAKASFATLMFARDAPKLNPKELLNIPLTVPPQGTPPPKLKYTIAGVKRGDAKRKSFKSGRSYISIHSRYE
jgi:hypothetical protein